MPPKPALKAPDVERRPSTAEMPPPPQPTAILQPETEAMAACLKSSAAKAAQIYKFFADARRLGIEKHAPNPPRSLTTALGTQVAKYDQLCDHAESRLLRAIAVLQQELTEEERRMSKAQATAPSSPMSVDQQLPPSGASAPPTTPATSPVVPTNSAARRGSTISLSSLNRAPFPHKLDLSTVRGPADDILALSSGLSSPVTLAPKSARPMSSTEYSNDLMMAALTSSSSDPSQAPLSAAMGGPPPGAMGPPPPPQAMETIDLTGDLDVPGPGEVGGSAEKPIELDLDGMDLDMSMDINMDILGGQGATGEKANAEQGQGDNAPDTAMFDLTSFGDESSTQKDGNEPSPGSLLAQFQSSEAGSVADSTNDLFGDSGGGENTNIDFGTESFSMGDMNNMQNMAEMNDMNNMSDMNMMDFTDMGNLNDLLSMGGSGGEGGTSTMEQQTSDGQQPQDTIVP
ncbi:uncharacterized protein SCHCODRAFT_02503457 [Schizophyllum commune H4-8]|nr:uncharacterized protein SCHCODRAFT_02503457 [Schizophyllum commune H4-8]KAI5892835.1 hypothetical protein SCHCODRAFT_02503457 [Schizophyllum commune H4-8]